LSRWNCSWRRCVAWDLLRRHGQAGSGRRDPSNGSCAKPGMVSFCRGRSDAAYSLWRGAGDCAWQRTVGARLAVSADAANGGYQSGIARCFATRTSGAECDRYRTSHSTRTRNSGCKRPTTNHCTRTANSESKYRSADRFAWPHPQSADFGWHSRAGYDRCACCRAGIAGALQCGCLFRCISFFHRIGLHLSTK
jgi:hypothetical protein